jgi:sugar phosphate isomerase/epimerase
MVEAIAPAAAKARRAAHSTLGIVAGDPLRDIRIGTMIKANAPNPAAYVRQILPHGFESIEPFFWQTIGNKDLPRFADELKDAIGDSDVVIDTLGMFGNPLENGDLDQATLAGWEALIDNAHHFGARTIAGFTGRIRGQPIKASLPRYKEVWGRLARRAADNGVRIAFENCAMDGNWTAGDWNIAHNPDAWEMMFDALPDDNVGLEWEPCHQLVYLIDPVPQIRKWAPKIFHVHGKDATIRWDVIREHGIFGKLPFVQMRTPGFGDSDWTRIIGELRLAGYRGTIDIEGWHDPVYREAMEMSGQVRALNFLKDCRGGAEFVANPN